MENQNFLSVAQDVELQKELAEAYHDESRVDDWNDGLGMLSGDAFFQVKHATGEDVHVYKLEVFELPEVFEQISNNTCDLLAGAAHKFDVYFAERTHLMEYIDESVRTNAM